jgi:predicted MFS family arabinose efflux permease
MNVRNYAIVTAGYWAFTLTDGALRMLVLLHFHDLGYSPVSIAFLFLAYEAMGIVTNLLGGWVGVRAGLHRTLLAGLGLQIIALCSLAALRPSWPEWLAVVYVMAAQALSGIAKDLTKLSSKSAVKFVADDARGRLFRLVAILTGSKNALKGVGFFLGAALLASLGFEVSLLAMAAGLAAVLAAVWLLLDGSLGQAKRKAPIRSILSKSPAINLLAAARFFLFASRDIWFVVALPIFLGEQLGWSFQATGGFLALWVIGYGAVQSMTPQLLRGRADSGPAAARAATRATIPLAGIAAAIALAVSADMSPTAAVVIGLLAFGAVFAVNSSLHSFLILAISDDDVSLDVGFYYSANAAGRLVGTLLSGVLYLAGGLAGALWGTVAFVVICWAFTRRLSASGMLPATPSHRRARA